MSRTRPDAITIGRDDASCDIVVGNAPGVSSVHCSIRFDAVSGSYVVQDLGSTNGTAIILGTEVRPIAPGTDAPLLSGSILRLGSTWALEPGDALFAKLQRPGQQTPQIFLEDGGPITTDGLALRRLVPGSQAVAYRASPAGPQGSTSVPAPSGRRLRVGRHPDADIVLDAPMISGYHIEIELAPDRQSAVVTDLQSCNGLFVNRRDNRVSTARVGPGDVLFLGSYRLPVNPLLERLERGSTATGGFKLPIDGHAVLGRKGHGADVEIDAPQVSVRHAEVRITAGRVFLRDLGSRNGTWVNDVRIGAEVEVRPGDRVTLGSFPVELVPSRAVVPRTYAGHITLSVEGVRVDVPDRKSGQPRRLIEDVSLTVYPSEFVGLMGPSGAGKTTLLQALNGYTAPSAGRVLINGVPLHENFGRFRGDIGYVPQDDIVLPQLTVYESLRHTARLRLPPDTSDAEIDARIDALLQRLEIASTRDVVIGDALNKGISGGQRKRVNLAQELLTEPSLLFLDEPTSGLASEDTLQVMRLLRELADSGKTIVLTIHQPSLEAYKTMDSVIYLLFGQMAYYGPAWPDSILHMNAPRGEVALDDPGLAMRPLAEDARKAQQHPDPTARLSAERAVAAQRAHTYRQSVHFQNFVAERLTAAPPPSGAAPRSRTEVTPGLAEQCLALARRSALVKIRDRANTAILIAQAPIIAALIVFVFREGHGPDTDFFQKLESVPAILFMLVASAVWFGCSNTAREITAEQAVYRRERMVNLRIDSYVLSKFLVFGATSFVQCALLLAIAYLGLGLEGPFLPYLFTLVLASWAGLGMGLLLSALVRTTEAAAALVPILLIPQIVLGGILFAHAEQPDPVRAVAGATITRWGMEAMLHIERHDEEVADIAQACNLYKGLSLCAAKPGELPCARVKDSWVPCAKEPLREPVCLQFCEQLGVAKAITPVDRLYGIDADDGLRQALDPPADPSPLATARSGTNHREAIGNIWLVLAGMSIALLSAVGLMLKHKDPRPS